MENLKVIFDIKSEISRPQVGMKACARRSECTMEEWNPEMGSIENIKEFEFY